MVYQLDFLDHILYIVLNMSYIYTILVNPLQQLLFTLKKIGIDIGIYTPVTAQVAVVSLFKN